MSTPIPPTLKLSIVLNANKTKKSKVKGQNYSLRFSHKDGDYLLSAQIHLSSPKLVQKPKSHETTKQNTKKMKRKIRKQTPHMGLDCETPQA